MAFAWIPPPVKPEGVFHNWDLRLYSPDDLFHRTVDIVKQTKKILDKVSRAKVLTYETVLKPVLDAHQFSCLQGVLVTFPRHVSECPVLRQAAADATRTLEESNVEMSMRKDIFDKLVLYKEKFSSRDNLNPELARCLNYLIHNGRRNGLHLNEGVRNKIKSIKKRLSELQLQFTRNLAEENSYLLLSYEDLTGMPYSFIEGLNFDPDTKKYEVTLKSHHFFPVTRKCGNPETRRIMEYYYQSRCQPQNTKILEEIIELRQQEAELLGYRNHASYIQDILMAKNPQNVKKFLIDLTKKLKPPWEIEKKQLLELKKKECEKYNLPFNERLELWDFRYYTTLVEEEMYTINQDEVMEYFPLDFVTHQMLSIYEQLLNLKFSYLGNVQKWHDDVIVYRVKDGETDHLMGYIYLDLYPRPGKFGHACSIPLQAGCLDSNGRRQCAMAAMLTNFNRPKHSKPTLLDHKEVEQYFHEFGHLMHTICSKAETPLFFGTKVETDFVEAPSQMLENWVWHPEPLQYLSRHFKTTHPLPRTLINKLIRSRRANAAGLNLRQVVFAIFDQEIHSGGRCDTQKLYAKILKDIMGIDAIPETNMPCNFNHLCVGYSGRYYSYLWSEVFSMDMFNTTFEKLGVMNPVIGMRYRKCILEPGGSVNAVDMIRNFLGREPNNNAFLQSKGLKSN